MAAEAAVRGPEAPLEPEPELGPGPSEAELELEGEELVLDEVDVHIQANLEDALVQEALKTGVDLREYSKQVELELQEVERASIRDYIKESENIASLHNQITACDAILERMEQTLGAFQCDLSSISCHIRVPQRMEQTLGAFQCDLSSISCHIRVPQRMEQTLGAFQCDLSSISCHIRVPQRMEQTLGAFQCDLSSISCHIRVPQRMEQTLGAFQCDLSSISCHIRVPQRMEQMLGAFQCDLSSISCEIRALQEHSVAMTLRLRNRRAVRRQLGRLLDQLVVPPAMISAILEAPVTEPQFLEQLQELNGKIDSVKEQAFRDTVACADVQHVLEKLKIKAVTKIREFVLQKIYSFRKPMTNYQIPQNALLKYRFFYQFLLANERAVAQELREQYVDTVGKIYLSYFKSYTARLMKIQYEEVAEKDDLMGVEDTAKKGFFSKPSLKNRNTVFTLGNRGGVIAAAELEAPIIVPHAAQRSDLRFPFESLFRSQHYALLDTGCREFAFLCDFFMVTGPSALQLFDAVMGKTLAMVLKHVDAYVCDCYDGIAVFLCIHIVLRFRALVAKRNIPALDRYWEALLELLWPRFEHILELNIQSIQSTDPQKLGFLDTRPHYITRRYAEFSSAIVSINQTFPNEKTNALLGQLQVEVENFVLRVAAEFSSRKEQLIFLINNYDMMLGVLMERAVEESKEVEGFQQLLSARTQEFIEELLSPPFGGMIAFVKEAEALLEKGQLERLRGEEARVTQLARGFSSTWKASVESLSQDVMRSFSNFKNGTSIIQGALTQLIQYYHRFHKVLAQPPLRALPVRADLINIHHLMVELKKHKPNF